MKSSELQWFNELPDDWESMPLRYAVEHKNVKNYNPTAPYLSLMANIGVIPYEEKGDIGNKAPEDLTRCKIVTTGDFVINSMNYQIGSYGRSAYSGVCSPVYIILRALEGRVDPRFIYRMLQVPAFQKHAQTFGNGILEHRKSISWDTLKNQPMPIPPLSTQRAIADYLDRETSEIDAFIADQKVLISLLEERRTATITQAVTKGLNPDATMKESRIAWVGSIPADWNIKRMSWLFRTISSGTTPPKEKAEYYDGDFHWVTTGELRERGISRTKHTVTGKALDDFPALRVYEPNTLLIAMYGATIGRLGLLEVSATTNQACCAFTEPIDAIPRFVFYVLRAAREHLMVMADGGGQPNINQEKLRSLRVPHPAHEVQEKIVAYLDREIGKIDSAIEDAGQVIALSKERRAAVISAAVTGKIDVHDVPVPTSTNKVKAEYIGVA